MCYINESISSEIIWDDIHKTSYKLLTMGVYINIKMRVPTFAPVPCVEYQLFVPFLSLSNILGMLEEWRYIEAVNYGNLNEFALHGAKLQVIGDESPRTLSTSWEKKFGRCEEPIGIDGHYLFSAISTYV